MIISTRDIIKKFNSGFGSKYKPYSKMQYHNSQLWNRFLSILQDANLMNKIIFSNDIGKVPPAEIFCNLPQNIDLKKVNLDDHSKRFIGAGFGFVFKDIFNYQKQHKKNVQNNIIQTAQWYYDNPDTITVE